MMLGLIIIPSVFSGMSFWGLAAYRNGDLELLFAPHSNQNTLPVIAGNTGDILISLPVQTESSDDNYIVNC